MTKYLVLYRSDVTAPDQMSANSSAEAEAGMEAWMAWHGKAGEAIVDFGSPVFGGQDPTVGGYSILQADSRQALDAVLADHPHLAMGTLDVLEFAPLPGAEG